MRIRAPLFCSALVATVVLLTASEAMACSCAGASMKRMFRSSDGAVVARLISVEDINDQRASYHYRILRVYKARKRLERGDDLVIEAASYGAACGLPRHTQRKYGLFLYREDGEWAANLCTVVEAWRMRRAGERHLANRPPKLAPAGCAAGSGA